MFFKKLKQSLSLLLVAIVIIPSTALAYSEYIIPGGENVGIEVKSKGVLIVGVYEIDGVYPAIDAGLKIGDTILKVNNTNVTSIDELVDIINNSNTSEVEITYERNNKKLETKLKITNIDGTLKTGLYVKDTITGIGTLTYIDPETKLYGALGHEIMETNTGIMLDIKTGNIFNSEVINIERSENGNPGSKVANLKASDIQGNIFENTNKGIFGNYTNSLPNKQKYKVANIKDIELKEAKILTVLQGNEIKEYNINIIKVNKSDTKNILFEITDQELLNKTGGIIQGMSGSPIIQGEYIIGAVTHVVVDNPTRGYGIFITNMLEEAEN